MKSLAIVCLGAIAATGMARAEPRFTLPHIINVDHEGLTFQATFDRHPGGLVTYAWNSYRASQERIFSASFDGDQRSKTQQMTAGEGVYYQPVFVATGPRSGWLFWQEQIGRRWRIVGRRLSEGFWKPIELLSDPSRDSLFPAAVVWGDRVAVAWEDHAARTQQIRLRVWDGSEWGAGRLVSQPDRPSYRPVLAAGPDGELWAVWDAYEAPDYAVYARRISPPDGVIERISAGGKSCLMPATVFGDNAGLTVAWVAVVDVIGGAGVLDQWNTIQVARRSGGRWEVTRDDAGDAIADLRHSMLNTIEPEAGPIWGYSGRRRHPMLVESAGDVWLLWERKIHHEGRSTEPGQLSGRRFEGERWTEPVKLHEGLVRYEVPSSRRAKDGRLTILGMDTRHGYTTFDLDLAETGKFEATELSGWKPVKLPLYPEAERPAVEIDGEKYNLYWGDLHVHTALTEDAEGEVDELMHFARDKAKVDVVVMQENDATSWLDVNPQGAFRGGTLTQSVYALSVYYSRRYTEPRRFIALPGWEWSHRTDDGKPNHRTVIFAGDETPVLRHTENGGDFNELCDVVEAAGGVMNTQHPDYQLVRRPCDANIEVAAGWGVYINHPEKIHADLSAGFEVGFVATSDGHRRDPGTGGGLTGIYAPELTSEAILEALREHRVYATNGSRIFLDARANGEFMGRAVRAKEAVELTLKAQAPKPIVRAVLVRDGDEILVVDGKGRREIKASLTDRPAAGYHWYYWRVEQEGESPDYPGNMKVAEGHLAWTSPHRVRVVSN